ncbi:MAG: phage tail tape measure protein [Planctomycetales bacterium]|nr:phage tail tape measure protein [Planctomycetales bacterium]
MATASDVRAGLAYIELTVRNKVRQGLAQASMDFNRFITRLQRAGFGMMLGGGFLAAPVIAAADSAADLERTLAIVKVTTDDATGSMDTLRDSVKRTARELPFMEADIARAALELARSGAGRYQVSESLPGVAQFAMLADMELPAAATMLSRTAKAMQIDMADLGRVANVAAIAANSTAQNAEELGVALSYAAGPAKRANVELEELATLLELIVEGGGGAGSRAGAGLANAMQTTRTKAEELKKLFDVDVANSDGFLTSFVDQMRQLRAARERLGSDQFQVNLDEVYQKRDSRIIGAIVAAFDQYDDRLKRVTTETDFLNSATQDLNQTQGFLWSQVKSIGDALKNTFGKAITSDLGDLVDTIRKAATLVTNWIQDNERLVSSIGKTVLVVLAVGTGVWLLGMALQALAFGIGPFVSLLTLSGSLIGQFATLAMMNPFGLAVIGVGSLIAGISTLGGSLASLRTTYDNHLGQMRQSIDQFADSMREAFEIGNAEGMVMATSGNAQLGFNQLFSDASQVGSDILGGIELASAQFSEAVANAAGLQTEANSSWTRERLAQERAARQHAIDDERRALEYRIDASNREFKEREAQRQADLEVEQRKAEEAARRAAVDKQREEVQRAISRQLEGSVTSGSFSGFLANAVSNFAQTRGVEQRQIELLERLEDTMDDVASNTEVLRDITGLTFTGEA